MNDLLLKKYEDFRSSNINIDITRGKPEASQLDLSNDLLNIEIDHIAENNVDIRNYGEPLGLIEARRFGSELLDAPVENIITGEQSSLLLTYQTILAHYLFGKSTPWKDIKNPKFICPVPGFDRHFQIFEDFKIEMIPLPLVEEGIDLKALGDILETHENVMGIICVPRHSNPSGEVYSDANIKQMFDITKKYSEEFLILFDNAYLFHDFLPTKEQTPVWKLAEELGSTNQVVVATSFSKVTFGGGGLTFMAADADNLELIKRIRTSMVICPDKVNQIRHLKFIASKDAVLAHMQKHAALVRPKFELVYEKLDSIGDIFGSYTKPTGGYFITYKTKKPIANKVNQLCKEMGVLLTPASAIFPYGHNPDDNLMRIAPTFITINELEIAMDVFLIAVQMAHND
ncbi:MAG: aminotransferase class I/II-fold pyridoxal phosphate-dependent enzyme [Gammaproteobacteria bacterium]